MKAKTLTHPREVAEGQVTLLEKVLKAQALEHVLSSNTDSLYISGLLCVSLRTGIKCTSKEQLDTLRTATNNPREH
jgi:hypothetical protein